MGCISDFEVMRLISPWSGRVLVTVKIGFIPRIFDTYIPFKRVFYHCYAFQWLDM